MGADEILLRPIHFSNQTWIQGGQPMSNDVDSQSEPHVRHAPLTTTDLELFQVFISYIRHENELLHHRTTWFLAIQSLLAAATGFVFNTYLGHVVKYLNGSAALPSVEASQAAFMWIACAFIGVGTSHNACISINAALRAQDAVEALWKATASASVRAQLPDMMGGKRDLKAKRGGRLAKQISAYTRGIWWSILAVTVLTACAKIGVLYFAASSTSSG